MAAWQSQPALAAPQLAVQPPQHRFARHPLACFAPARTPLFPRHALGMTRTRSHEEEDTGPARLAKRSRPATPNSTAPPSPSFSNGSGSPTPDHTPLATPAHSPHLRPLGAALHDLHLPGMRSLTLHPHGPMAKPMEPRTGSISIANPSPLQFAYPDPGPMGPLSEIMSQPAGSRSLLPLPKPATGASRPGGCGPRSGLSSSSSSSAAGR